MRVGRRRGGFECVLTYICIGSLILNLVLLERVWRLAKGLFMVWQRVGDVEAKVEGLHGDSSNARVLASLRSSGESPRYSLNGPSGSATD